MYYKVKYDAEVAMKNLERLLLVPFILGILMVNENWSVLCWITIGVSCVAMGRFYHMYTDRMEENGVSLKEILTRGINTINTVISGVVIVCYDNSDVLLTMLAVTMLMNAWMIYNSEIEDMR